MLVYFKNTIVRPTLLLCVLVLLLSSCSQIKRSENTLTTKPNVVVILVDDLGYADIKAYNPDSFYDTPNVDKLAEQGIKFVNGYAANPVCSPSRYALNTGKHPTRANATDWFHPHDMSSRTGNFRAADFDQLLPHEELTIAEAFRQNGYKTAFLGKWHLGEPANFWPEHHGFDVNIGGMKSGQPPGGYFSPYKNARLTDGPDGEYLTERLTNEAISLVDGYAKQQSPFFMLLSFYTVHTPLQAPSETVDKYQQKAATLVNAPLFESEEQVWPTDKERRVRVVQNHPTYAAMVNKMDTQVGRLLRKLDQAGVADNTIIVFTSDNGGLSTAEGSPTANLPLRGGKGWLYEGGIRVPFIIKMPNSKANSSVFTQPVVSTDLYPTLLSAANLKLQPQQHLDGTDLTVFTESTDRADLSQRALYFHYPHYSNQGGFPGAAVRQGDWKLIERFEDGKFQLYNLAEDVGEKTDLSEAMPDKVKELRTKLHQWYLDTEARFLNPLNGQIPWSPQFVLKD